MSQGWSTTTPYRYCYETRDDGIYFCTGDHHRSQGCEWQKLTLDDLLEWTRKYEHDRLAGWLKEKEYVMPIVYIREVEIPEESKPTSG